MRKGTDPRRSFRWAMCDITRSHGGGGSSVGIVRSRTKAAELVMSDINCYIRCMEGDN
jgi:hypothetical protein